MPSLSVGPGASNRASTLSSGITYVDLGSYVLGFDGSHGVGLITSIELWFASDATGVYVGTFKYTHPDFWYYITGQSNGNANIGNVTSGSKQTFSGLSIYTTTTYRYLGVYFASGFLEMDSTGGPRANPTDTGNFIGTIDGHICDTPPTVYETLSIYGTGYTSPTVTTQAATSVLIASAVGNGNVTDGDALTQRGICYNTTGAPTTADSKVYDTTNAEGAFAFNLTGLLPNTKYYARAYAINTVGTSYGDTVEFTTAMPISILIF